MSAPASKEGHTGSSGGRAWVEDERRDGAPFGVSDGRFIKRGSDTPLLTELASEPDLSPLMARGG